MGEIIDAKIPDEVGKSGKIMVTRTYKKSGAVIDESSSEDQLEVQRFVTFPATVSMDGGMTLNLGNFESMKIGVFASIPCYKEEINEAFEYVKELTANRLSLEVREAQEFRESRKKAKSK